MAHSKVQFQKGISLTQFLKEYGTEDQYFGRSAGNVGQTAFVVPTADTANIATSLIVNSSNVIGVDARHRLFFVRSLIL